MGWPALQNGALLSEAEKNGFAVLPTPDKGIKSQQRMEGWSIAVIILRAHNTKLTTHLPMLAEVLEVLAKIQPGEVAEVCHPDMKP